MEVINLTRSNWKIKESTSCSITMLGCLTIFMIDISLLIWSTNKGHYLLREENKYKLIILNVSSYLFINNKMKKKSISHGTATTFYMIMQNGSYYLHSHAKKKLQVFREKNFTYMVHKIMLILHPIFTKSRGRRYLINHSVLENGAFGHNFHGYAPSCLHVLCKLNLGESPFANGPADFILTHLPRHLFHDSFNCISRTKIHSKSATHLKKLKKEKKSTTQILGTKR